MDGRREIKLGNILTEIKMESCCRKIHILNAAANERHNVPVERWHFLINIPKQFSERLDIQRGDKVFCYIDEGSKKLFIFTKRFVESLDFHLRKNFPGCKNPFEIFEKRLQFKASSPNQYAFYIGYDSMYKLGWPPDKGTIINLKIIDETMLRIKLLNR